MPEPTWTQVADVEEGDLTDFNSTTTSGAGLIAASLVAALAGSYGVLITTVEGTAGETAFGTLSGTTNQVEKTVEFLLEIPPAELVMANGDIFNVMLAVGSGTGTFAFTVFLRYTTASGYEILPRYFDDAGTGTTLTGQVISAGASHKIRITWKAATGAGANNGYLNAYVDEVRFASYATIDNDGHDVDLVRFGAVTGIDAGTGGIFYLDNCQVYDGIAGITYNQSPSGAITPTGSITRLTGKVLTGAITPAGTLAKLTAKFFSGVITPVGTLTKNTAKAFAGIITPAGSITKNISKILSGIITPVGTLFRDIQRLLKVRLSKAPTADILVIVSPTANVRTNKSPTGDIEVSV